MLICIFMLTGALTVSAAPRRPASVTSRDKNLVDIDLGGSAGTYNGRTYSEVNLGVNINFTDWLTWRNAGFKRFSSQGDIDITGLDSTLRLISISKFEGGSFRVFAGAGYRFANPSEKNATLGEAGLGIQVGRFGISGGAKYLKYDKVQLDSAGAETKRDDLVYFVTLSGGAGLSF